MVKTFSSAAREVSDKRWALVAIFLGTTIGFLSVFICVYWHLAIFGFNIAYVISPLIAGFVETYIAKKKYGRSTGALSAIVLFVAVNVVGWVLPENPVTLNLFTLGGLALAFQAAFPILVNYLIFVVFLGSFTYALGYLGNLIARFIPRLGNLTAEEEAPGWNTLILNTPNIEGKRIVKYLGLVDGGAVINGKNGRSDYGKEFERAVIKALKVMDVEAKSRGANAVLDVQIGHNKIAGINGGTVMVNVMGNAVRYE